MRSSLHFQMATIKLIISTVLTSSMTKRTLNGLMTVKYALRVYDNTPLTVPITEELITLSRSANKNYINPIEMIKKGKKRNPLKNKGRRKRGQ